MLLLLSLATGGCNDGDDDNDDDVREGRGQCTVDVNRLALFVNYERSKKNYKQR